MTVLLLTIDVSDILEIHNYLIKRHNIAKMPEFITQTFTGFLLVPLRLNGLLATCMTRPMLSDLNADNVHYYTVEDLLGRICLSKNIIDGKLK